MLVYNNQLLFNMQGMDIILVYI